MNPWHANGFEQALLDPAAPLPEGIVVPAGQDPRRRFDVYRNNVIAGLVDALIDGFPALVTLLGEDCFRSIARCFVPEHLPDHPVLSRYGAALPAFLEAFEPLARWPWLGDVARLELARRQAHDAADGTAAAAITLSSTDPERIGYLVPLRHPSALWLSSRWPLLALWQTGLGAPAPDLNDASGEDVLVVRPAAQVRQFRLPTGGTHFLANCNGSHTLAEVFAATLKASPATGLAELLALLVHSGAISDFRTANSTSGN